MTFDEAMTMVMDEYNRAQRWPAMNSAHEGFAVLNEEVDELWDEVKVRQPDRDLGRLQKEAVQVAAMAVRFLVDVCNPETGRR